jgi:hypothetical protein
MSTPEPPDDPEQSAQTPTDEGSDDNDHSIVSPPAYPAYSTPPPEGLATNEDG